MNWVIVAFLLMIAATLGFGAWVAIRQERYARHRCPHPPVIGQAYVYVVSDDTDPSAELRVAEFGTQDRGPTYDLHLGLQSGGPE